MHSPSQLIRPLLALAALAGVVVAASGCGTTNADTTRGRVLFVQKCGTCHALAQAGTTAQIGPEPRRRLRRRPRNRPEQRHDRRDRQGPGREPAARSTTTRRSRCRPRSSPARTSTTSPPTSAMYAGVPGAAPPQVPGGPGAQVFANNGCGGCHTLAAAKSGGVTGPNLDEVLPGQTLAMIHEDDRRPEQGHRQGLPAERDAGELRADPVVERTRRPRRIPVRRNLRRQRLLKAAGSKSAG